MAGMKFHYLKQEAHQSVGLGKTPRHSTLQYRQTFKFSVASLVILRQDVTELCASMPAAPVLHSVVQYLVAFCS